MEFWNRNVRRVWSLDGTAPGPGPVLTPNIESTDGRLAGDPGYRYAVVDKGLSIVGETDSREGRPATRPDRIAPSPARVAGRRLQRRLDRQLEEPADTVSADYSRFDAPAKPGTVFVTLSRKAFCGTHARPDGS